MMLTFPDWYPGDPVLEYVSIVALGVTLLSTIAWAVAWPLPNQPVIRHLVLVSALFGCLGMPVLAAASAAFGFRLVSIPILPAQPAGIVSVAA